MPCLDEQFAKRRYYCLMSLSSRTTDGVGSQEKSISDHLLKFGKILFSTFDIRNCTERGVEWDGEIANCCEGKTEVRIWK